MDVSLSPILAIESVRSYKPGDSLVQRTTSADQVTPEANSNALGQDRQPLAQALSSIEEIAQSFSRDLDFSLDDSTGRMVIKVTDRASGDVVRQIPSEEALRLAENLEQVRSLLFKAEA
ncbi:MAG TPA: flagellar biosynthesis protein FlaG [Pseudomonas sp.]|nr:flagellar biosynthesis protein FlaG [Pseudomonas sp.]